MSGGFLAARALAALLPPDRRDELLADLDEEFLSLSTGIGLRTARRWRRAQLLRSVGPIFCRWLELRLASAFATTKPPSIGQAFFALAVAWFACVAWSVPLDNEPTRGIAAESEGWQPSTIILEDGAAHLVYSLGDRPERRDAPQSASYTHFFLLAIAPPAAMFICLLSALPILGAPDRRRRRATS